MCCKLYATCCIQDNRCYMYMFDTTLYTRCKKATYYILFTLGHLARACTELPKLSQRFPRAPAAS